MEGSPHKHGAIFEADVNEVYGIEERCSRENYLLLEGNTCQTQRRATGLMAGPRPATGFDWSRRSLEESASCQWRDGSSRVRNRVEQSIRFHRRRPRNKWSSHLWRRFEATSGYSTADRTDLEQILHLQKCSYLSEAEIYNDYSIKPLTQKIDDIKKLREALIRCEQK